MNVTIPTTGILGLLFLFTASVAPLVAQDDKDIIDQQKREIEKLQLTLKKVEADAKALTEERDKLLKVIAERDAQLLASQTELLKWKNAQLNTEAQLKALQAQNDRLAEKVREMELFLAKKAIIPGKIDPKKLVELNPPAVLMKGTIEKVDGKDRTLVTVSIGSDMGLEKNHTLEVFRLKPAPQYLGSIRIVDVFARSAVGRLIPPPDGRKIALQPGDQVTSRFGPGEVKKK